MMVQGRTVLAALLLLACSEEAPDPPAASGVTWCQTLGVLEASCQRCHGDPLENRAPWPLLTYEHTQAPYYNTDLEIFEKMRTVVAADFMPLELDIQPPVQPLSCEQKTTLLTWLDEGAQPVGGLECNAADKSLLPCDAVLGAPAPEM
jgi:hypothetical protein